MLDRTQLAKIHVAKKQLAMDDDTYRLMLQNVAGVSSAKDLTVPLAMKVMAHLKKCGFKPKATVKHGKRPQPTQDKTALMGKIEAQLTEAQRHWNYAHAMAKRMFKVDRVDWCDAEQLQKIVAALTYNAKRAGRTT
ncbi:gp16 family protein [Iodobacter sp.]|uniref:gp16 family protein n=1 Tax=Iodobacter sp. TaxID=1915058 RepID=UPI0025CFE1DE|nr:regulatory protein GemA [Iodobacter sp.]